MRIFVDIDETICFYDGVERLGYKNSIPNQDNISKINKLYDEGNEITYWTARGSVTGMNHLELTTSQLKSWGCKYTSLRVGDKPHYDVWIDDKAVWSEEYFRSY